MKFNKVVWTQENSIISIDVVLLAHGLIHAMHWTLEARNPDTLNMNFVMSYWIDDYAKRNIESKWKIDEKWCSKVQVSAYTVRRDVSGPFTITGFFTKDSEEFHVTKKLKKVN